MAIKGLQQSMAKSGEIRIGVYKDGRPQSLGTFRFTSTNESHLNVLAGLYGGKVEPWINPLTKVKSLQLITTAATIRALIPPCESEPFLEFWTAAGMGRKCDRERCTTFTPQGEQYGPCQCVDWNMHGEGTISGDKMQCKPKIRLPFFLPELPMMVWRMTSASMVMLGESLTMYNQLAALAKENLFIPVTITLTQRQSRTVKGGARNYSVAVIEPSVTVAEFAQLYDHHQATKLAIASGNAGAIAAAPVQTYDVTPSNTAIAPPAPPMAAIAPPIDVAAEPAQTAQDPPDNINNSGAKCEACGAPNKFPHRADDAGQPCPNSGLYKPTLID